VIGDIHGRYDKFEALMRALGYRSAGRGFVPPHGRQAVFVGDLIDRGPQQVRLLETVRSMVDAGHARAVLGNHEFNAMAYVTPDPAACGPVDCLRVNRGSSEKCAQNREQHAEFLAQVGEGSATHRQWVEWFRTLPFALDLGGIRVAHAWWDDAAVEQLGQPSHRDAVGRLTDEFLVESHRRDSALKDARKIVITGHEHTLPPGHFVTDGKGHKHDNARLKVWKQGARRLREIAIVPGGDTSMVPDLSLEEALPKGLPLLTGTPILVGHYWYSGEVRLESDRVAVLDWSAAEHGPLVAYRWDGEPRLSSVNLVQVNV